MDIFKGIKPSPYPLRNKLGYGCITTSRKKYNKVNKRKLFRSIRKLGFDYSECWNLDYSVMCWFSDNVGGFFRSCGAPDDWSDYDLNGYRWPNYNKDTIELEQSRRKEYLAQVSNYLHNCTGEEYLQFLDFIIPRLIYLIEHIHGYPATFNTFADWQNELKFMVTNLPKRNNSINTFVENLYSLWD